MSSALERVHNALVAAGCRRQGRNWTCPAHDDRNPSLSVAEGAEGRVLVHCHSGCSAEDVAQAMGLKMTDLFPDVSTGVLRRRQARRNLTDRLAQAIDEGAEELPAATPREDIQAWLDRYRNDEGDYTGEADAKEVLLVLAELDDADYEPLRREIGRASGWRLSAIDNLRDEACRDLRRLDGEPAKERTIQGTSLSLADPEPWPELVDGAGLLAALAQTFARFMALVDGAATALALWSVFAHAHDAADVSPLLALVSPEKRCGKTTALTVLRHLVPKPLAASNITPAALFRAIEKWRPTLLVDEADSFLGEREELRGILNSGHTRGTAYVIRTVGEDHEPAMFSTWGPKAVALIGNLQDTLQDRSVVVPMRRKTTGEKIERLRLGSLDLQDLLRQAARWAADHGEAIRNADPDVPDGLNDRAADNWRTLLAIADEAGGVWPDRAREAARLLSGVGKRADGSVRVLLLSDLRELFDEFDACRLASQQIVDALTDREDRPWPEWRRGRPLSTQQLATLLRHFDVRPRQMKIDGKKVRGYERADLEEVWERYTPAQAPDSDAPSAPGTPGTTHAGSGNEADGDPVPEGVGTGCRIAENPYQDCKVPRVPGADPSGEQGRYVEVEL